MSPIANRIKRLCLLLFSDIQQREAARQIGVAQPLLSRTLSGDRLPSKTLIEKLSEYPGVNARWLLDGVGEPLLHGGTSLPVIEKLPKEQQTGWQACIQPSKRKGIAENSFSDSRYWFRITEATLKSWDEWVHNHVQLQVGDHLLLETCATQIQSLLGPLRLGVVAHPAVAKGKPTWGAFANEDQFIGFGPDELRNQPKSKNRASSQNGRREIKRSLNPTKALSPPLLGRSQPALSAIVDFDQVLAVVLEMTSKNLFRLFPDSQTSAE